MTKQGDDEYGRHFRDIAWLRRRDKEQQRARANFQKYLHSSKLKYGKKSNTTTGVFFKVVTIVNIFDFFLVLCEHKKMDKILGPRWFQELSTTQLMNVDLLKANIELDIQHGRYINTKQILTKIGILLERNTNESIKEALNVCRSCPVEFLFSLYNSQSSDYTEKSIS